MPNKRKRNPPPIATEKEGKKTKIRDRNDFVDEVPDPHSREYLYDDIDEFHSDRDKILLGSDDEDRLEKEEYEEVLPLGDDLDESEDEDDLDDDDDDKKLLDNDYYERMAAKEEIGSDMEDEENDGLPDAKAWGKKKVVYYDTDYVDGDYGGFTGEDLQLAEAEEKEALAIQKRLLEQINEDDFGIDWLKPVEREKGEVEEEKVTLDLSRMSKNEKLELLEKESPEFLELIDDFKTLLKELTEKLNPLIPYAKEGKLSQGAEYVLFKHQLILLYCANISFYMVLKSRGNLRRNHPVIKKLAYFKKFLKELKVVDDKLAPYVENALERIKNNQTPEDVPSAVPASTNDKPKKKKLRIIKEMEERGLETKKTVRFADEMKGKKRMETPHEKEALQMYELTKERRQKNNQQPEEDESESESDDNPEEEEPEEGVETNEAEDDVDEGEEMNEKRGITYQIAKNKGLMPHRKKEHKNPRVKHRMKFRKAKIRRKGQVREVRTEKQRYGGEISGIRIGVKHGRKLK